jgi:peptide-methionine (R)-S-oxide reductase
MLTRCVLVSALLLICAAAPLPSMPATAATTPSKLKITPTPDGVGRVTLSNDEWKKRLSPGTYNVMREQGTEIAFTGKYWNNHAKGVYRCAACGLELFSSDTKFESGTGWPSFWKPIQANHVVVAGDQSLGMDREEVRCARCGGHLGHVFDDGPPPTNLRYCMNSAALEFVAAK